MGITVRPDWMTLSSIRDHVKLMVRDNSISDATYNKYINKAYKWMFYDQLWPTRRDTTTITLVADQADYELPTTVAGIDYARLGSLAYYVQDLSGNKQEFGPTNISSGRRLVVQGYTCTVQPTPGAGDAGSVITLSYWRNLFVYSTAGVLTAGGLVNDTDYPGLEGPLHQLLADKASLIAMSYNREDGMPPAVMANEFNNEYKKKVFMVVQAAAMPKQLRVRL